MRFLRRLLYCFLLIFLLLTGCDSKNKNEIDPNIVTRITVSSSQSDDEGYSNSILDDHRKMFDQKPKVPIQKNENLLQVINTNLDLDAYEEQILVIKMNDDKNNPLKLSVVDFDEIRNAYIRTWEQYTSSTNYMAYSVELKDMIGDYSTDIIFNGMNVQGELTLDIFRKTPSPNKLGLFYTPICQLASDGSIEIMEVQRSGSYQLGQKTGESYPVIVYRRDPDSTNKMDLIMEKYAWVYASNKYVLVSGPDKVPGEIIKKNQLNELYASTKIEPYRQFVSGAWYSTKSIDKMIVFMPRQEQIVFNDGDIQEVFSWEYSNLIYKGILIIARNINIRAVQHRITLTVTSLNSIDISISDNEWEGTYLKLSDELKESYFSKNEHIIKPSNIVLSGNYEADTANIQIIFEPPYFTWIENNQDRFGGFSIMSNMPILNEFYIKKKLQQIPRSIDYDKFKNEILAKLSLKSDIDLMKDSYKYNANTKKYVLSDDVIRFDKKNAIFSILVSVGYNGYIDYRLGVITFKSLNENTQAEIVNDYIMEYLERKELSRIVKSIVLIPGRITVKGIEAVSTEYITLVKTEYND